MNNKTPVCLILITAAIGFLAGCGRLDDGVQRVVVTGTVTYRGEPVSEGSMLLVPSGEAGGASLDTSIVDGSYRMDRQGGVPVGNYRVKILAYQKDLKDDGRRTVGPASQVGPQKHSSAPRQYLPEKYNVKTELKISVEAGAGSLVRDFALTE